MHPNRHPSWCGWRARRAEGRTVTDMPSALHHLVESVTDTYTVVAEHPRPGDIRPSVWEINGPDCERWFGKLHVGPKFHPREVTAYQKWTVAVGASRAPELVAADTQTSTVLITAVPGTRSRHAAPAGRAGTGCLRAGRRADASSDGGGVGRGGRPTAGPYGGIGAGARPRDGAHARRGSSSEPAPGIPTRRLHAQELDVGRELAAAAGHRLPKGRASARRQSARRGGIRHVPVVRGRGCAGRPVLGDQAPRLRARRRGAPDAGQPAPGEGNAPVGRASFMNTMPRTDFFGSRVLVARRLSSASRWPA